MVQQIRGTVRNLSNHRKPHPVLYDTRLRLGEIPLPEGPDGSTRTLYTNLRLWVPLPTRASDQPAILLAMSNAAGQSFSRLLGTPELLAIAEFLTTAIPFIDQAIPHATKLVHFLVQQEQDAINTLSVNPLEKPGEVGAPPASLD